MLKILGKDGSTEEDTGPSVDSADPEERILARRLRIAKRNEQIRREQMGVEKQDANEAEEEDKMSGKAAKQVEESNMRLEKLRDDGMMLVTNVRTASDAREMAHKIQDSEKTLDRNEKLEAEAKTSVEKFKEITGKWVSAHVREVPYSLHKLVVDQQKMCDMVIEEKNKIIKQIQIDLKNSDEEYVKDVKKQNESIDLIVERMEDQIKHMKKSYSDELHLIERVFIDERSEVLQANRKKFDKLLNVREQQEEELMRLRFERVDDCERQLDTLRINDQEEYNMVKIKLETDVQILEQQLQQMKATYQLNQEKLEYNFQVLKKRDEENMITKNQQKRRITKLQDQANKLNTKLRKQQKFYKDENQMLTEEYHRIAKQYKDLHKKMRNFSQLDYKRFNDIWVMNEAELRKLVDKVLLADKCIHQQQLGVDWQQPDMSFSNNIGPLNKVKVGKKEQEISASEFVQEVITGKSEDFNVSINVTRKLLEVICDEGGFLVEDKLKKLLAPLQSGEKSLIKLDAIFKALHITTDDDVRTMTSYFIRNLRAIELGFQPNRSEMMLRGDEEVENTETEASSKSSVSSVSSQVSENQDNISLHMEDGEVSINKNNILYVLRQFVNEYIKPKQEKEKKSLLSSFAASLDRDTSMDQKYWKDMSNVVSESRLKLWDAVLDSFEKYHKVLDARAKKIAENEKLRNQNAELRMLLHQYITSKVNNELEIPPTRVLQFEA